MSPQTADELGKLLWDLANKLRGAMNPSDFKDYMLSFIFFKYLSDKYEETAKDILRKDWPNLPEGDTRSPLKVWYEENPDDIEMFEKLIRRRLHYIIKPEYLWSHIIDLARTEDEKLLKTLREAFKFIENESFSSNYKGLFSEIHLDSDKLGKDYAQRNKKLASIISTIHEGLMKFPEDEDTLGDAYEYLIAKFAADAGKKAGEFYTPQYVSDILSSIVVLDSQDPANGKRGKLNKVLDFACGSGSLLLNVRRHIGPHNVGKLYGQEKNITTYNLARMNMLLHGVRDEEFEIYHGDTLLNEWPLFQELNPANKIEFDAVVANPPFSYRWNPSPEMADDFRFKGYGLAPKSAADYAFLLHGFHYLKKDGTMAIILPHGALFRKGKEAKIRQKLLEDNNIDAIIGLAPKLFYSTGIPVVIIVLKKCKKNDDVLFINASELYKKEKKQNVLTKEHVQKIVDTYKYRKEEERFSRRVSMDEIRENEYNLNITRYVSTAKPEPPVDLEQVSQELNRLEEEIQTTKEEINKYLKELNLKPLK